MPSIRARVHNGRLIVDEPTALPEGTVVNLIVDDGGDDLDDTNRAALDDAITRAWAAVQTGEGKSAAEVLAALRRR